MTLALSFDARTVYFAFADPAGKDPYTLPGYAMAPAEPGAKYNTFHIMAMDVDGSRLRQLTDGPYDDFDPCPLPDGGIAFRVHATGKQASLRRRKSGAGLHAAPHGRRRREHPDAVVSRNARVASRRS